MRVLFVLENAGIGGCEWNALLAARSLKARIPKVRLELLLTKGDGPMLKKFTEVFDKIQTVEFENRNNNLATYFKGCAFDAIHVFNGVWVLPLIPDDNCVILQLGGDLRRKDYYNDIKVANPKEHVWNIINKRKNTRVISDNLVNSELCPGLTLVDNFTRIITKPVSIARKKTRIIWVGRDSYEKRPDMYLAIAKKCPDYEFVFVRAGGGQRVLPENVIEYRDLLDEAWLAELYESSSFLINTSLTEGKPLTVKEAQSHGVITVGPCILEGIVDYHIQDDEDVDSYVATIEMLNDVWYSNKKSLDKLRDSNRKKMKDENNKVTESILAIYRKIAMHKRTYRPNTILFVVDQYDWAWAIAARELMRELPEYDCRLIDVADFFSNGLNPDKFECTFVWACDPALLAKIPPGRVIVCCGGGDLIENPVYLNTLIPYERLGALCPEHRKRLSDIFTDKRVFLTSHGVDTQLFQPEPIRHRGFVLGWAGRMNRDLKRFGWAKEIAERTGCDLKIASQEPEFRYTHRDINRFYNSIDALLVTSETEGHPMVVYEAMACGVPVIIGDVGDVKDYIVNDVNGMIVDKTRIDSYVCAVNRLLADKDKVKWMGRNAVMMIRRKLKWKDIAKGYLKAIDDVKDDENRKWEQW